jgi:hypothetical protein
MADEETIVIRVNAAQGEAALAALGAAGIKAGKDLESMSGAAGDGAKSLSDKYAALGAKLFGITKIIGAAGEAFKSASIAVGNYEGATKDAVDQVVNLTRSIASFDLAGTAAALGQLAGQSVAWAQGLTEVNDEMDRMSKNNPVAAKSLAELLKLQQELVQTRKDAIEAADKGVAAISREVANQERQGKVHQWLKDEIQEQLDTYYKLRQDVPPALQEIANRLEILATSQEKARDAAVDAANKELEARAKVLASLEGDSKEREHSTKVLLEAITAVESHGDVTQEQSAKIQAAVLAETKLYTDYGAVVPAQLQLVIDKYKVLAEQQAKTIKDAEDRLSKALSKAGKIDSSQDTSEIEQNLAGINREIKELEGSDIIDAGQQQRLDELKNSALDLKRSMGDLNRAFTVTNESFLTEEEAIEGANAALDVAIAYNEKVRRGMNALQSSTGKAADSFEDLADGAKKATEDGAEGVDKLKEGLQEAMPLAKEFLSIIREIKSEAAGIDF